MQKIFIPFNTPSSKNSKVNGRFLSASCRKYLQKLGIKSFSSQKKTYENYKTRPNIFLMCFDNFEKIEKYPVKIGFYFVRDSRRRFDFNNATQIICDLLTAHQIIEDDDISHILPFPIKQNEKWYEVNKEKAGCFLYFF